jgi:DNA polymerase
MKQELLAGQTVPAGLSFSTVLPDFDFETYSEAGFVWREGDQKWISISGAGKTAGISQVGAPVYAEHPSTEIISIAYDLKDGLGCRLWTPALPAPQDLLDHVASGGLLEAHNSAFEFYIWHHVASKKLGWPQLPIAQLRCSAAKAKAYSLPAALGAVSKVIGMEDKDSATGKRVIKRYCCPRKPTKLDPRKRILPDEEPQGIELYQYNIQDIVAEASVSLACPDLSPEELDMWILDQQINARGIQIDVAAVAALSAIVNEGKEYYDQRIHELTEGAVANTTKVKDLIDWLETRNVWLENLEEETLTEILGWEEGKLCPRAREALEIRAATSSAGVKKLQALSKRTSADNRMRDTLAYYRAHTGRWASMGLQLQNMVASGPKLRVATCCGSVYGTAVPFDNCCRCTIADPLPEPVEWDGYVMDKVIAQLVTCDFAMANYYYGKDLYHAIAASMRGMVTCAFGKELLCSDYSAIEAVVLAVLAGEQWRIDVFNTHGKIYEMCAAKITGVPFEEMMQYKEETGNSHPHRKPFGKVPELASGYQGWIGAWKQFGADEYMDEDTIKKSILKWREESPAIVEMWGGQYRETAPQSWEFKPELFGLEGTAVKACLEPGEWHTWRFIRYGVFGDVLYCLLPSGRCLSYHAPRLEARLDRRAKRDGWSLSHMMNNSNPKKGKMGWIRVETYGGMLTENAVQGVARDLLAHGIKNVERAGYPVVGHVHDEIIAEVDEGFGSIEEFESLMMQLPSWAQGWPIKAAGGWREQRYRKE